MADAGLSAVHPEDAVLVGIKGGRAAMRLQIVLQRREIGPSAFRDDEAHLHQLAGGIVDEHQERADRAAILEPAAL